MDWIQLGILAAVSVTALTPLFSYLNRRWKMRLTARQKEILRELSKFNYLDTYTDVLSVDLSHGDEDKGVRVDNGVIVPFSYLHDVWLLCYQHGLLRQVQGSVNYDSSYALEVIGVHFLQNNMDGFREKAQPSYLPASIWGRMGARWRWLIGV